MKKLLGLLSVGIISFGLAGCGNNNSVDKSSDSSKNTEVKLSKQDLRSKYANTSDAQADAYNAMLDNNEGKISNSTYSSKLQTAIDKVKGQNENLDATATNKSAAKDLTKFNNLGVDIIVDLKTNSKSLTSDMKSQSKLNSKVRSEINAPHPQKYNTAIDRWSTAVANQPHVSGNSVITKNYTIKITKTDTTPDYDGGTDIVIYYDFTNTSNSQNIEPEIKFMESKLTQENTTSIVTLDAGNPENDELFSTLEDNSQQEVKPGATVQCAATYKLDDAEKTSVKYEANDDHFNKIGTITLQLNQ